MKRSRADRRVIVMVEKRRAAGAQPRRARAPRVAKKATKAKEQKLGFYRAKKCVVYYDGTRKKPRRYHGLTERLANRLYPRYERSRAYKRWLAMSPMERAAMAPFSDRVVQKVTFSGVMEMGIKTGKTLEACDRLLNTYGVPQRCFTHQQTSIDWYKSLGAQAGVVRGVATHRKHLIEYWKQAEPYARQFFAYCAMRQWDVVGVEVPVGWAGRYVATRIDVLVRTTVDAEGGGGGEHRSDSPPSAVPSLSPARSPVYHVIEIKTGYNQLWNVSSGRMLEPPFDNHDDCFKNQAMLQASSTSSMARRTFPSRVFGVPYVMRLHYDFDPTKDVYVCEEWALNTAAQSKIESILCKDTGTTTNGRTYRDKTSARTRPRVVAVRHGRDGRV